MWIPLLVLATVAPDATCGSPSAPLEVHGQQTTVLVGEKQRLALWSNRRQDSELRFEWRLVSCPAGTGQAVVQSRGVSPMIRDWDCQHAYSDGNVPNFTPDLPGLYVFEVRTTELSTGQVAIGQGGMLVTAPRWDAQAPETGCSVVGGPLLLAGALLLRRRRLE